MGLPQLQTCCFVLDLKTGNIVLGCINAFLSFVMVVVFIVAAATFEVIVDEPTKTSNIELEAEMTGVYVMSIILILMFVVKFLFDVAFIYGVVMERPAIIKAYFIMCLVFFLLSIFTFFVNVTHYGGFTIFTELFYIGLNLYMVLISHSFYKQINFKEVV